MKVLILALALTLLVRGPANAAVMASLGSSLSFEQDTDGRSYDIKAPFSIRAGYRAQLADFYLEYSHFDRTTDVSIVDINRQHTEWIAWARHCFMEQYWVQPYAAFGAGFQYDTVSTNFARESARDEGVPDSFAAFAGGFRVLMAQSFSLELEAKAAFSRYYSPNPLVGVGLFAGIQF